MAVSPVWELADFLAACPMEPRSTPKLTDEMLCATLLKSKSKLLLV